MAGLTCEISKKKSHTILSSRHKIGDFEVKVKMPFGQTSKKSFIRDYTKVSRKIPSYETSQIPCIIFYHLDETVKEVLNSYKYLLSGNTQLLIKPVHSKGHRTIMEYYPDHSTKRKIEISVSWHWLIEHIVHPYLSGKEPDMDLIGRIVSHEIVGHFGDTLIGLDKKQLQRERKLEKANPRFRMLNDVLFDLRAEGLAMFLERAKVEDTVLFTEDWEEFNSNLRKMFNKRTVSSMKKFYDHEILVEEGLYNAGLAMCMVMALDRAKRDGVRIKLRPWRWSMNSWAGNKRIIVGMIPKPVFKKVHKGISEHTVPLLFIRHYYKACARLGIEEKNQVLPESLFYELVNKVTGVDVRLHEKTKKAKSFVDYYKISKKLKS